MHLNKEQVGDMLRARGEYDKAHQMENLLPPDVDTARDAGLLQRFEISAGDLERECSKSE